MSWEHLATILWLRWRMSVHQLRRGGVVSAIVLAVAAVSLVTGSVVAFFLGLLGGAAVLPRLSPEIVMLVWDGVALLFLFTWTTGLITELQRSEVISLEKLIRLPVSPAGAFVINYAGSLASVSLSLFLPGMVGLAIAHVVVHGPAALVLFPALAAFILLVTAITYQFQGWLASLMVNKRRRRTIVALVTLVFMLISQLPNLLGNFLRPDGRAARAQHEELQRLEAARGRGEISAPEYERAREAAGQRFLEHAKEGKQRFFALAGRANQVLPVGWLPLGAEGAARGNAAPGILGALGAGLIAFASLRRSYRTTLRLYTGDFTSKPAARRAAPPARPRAAAGSVAFLERDLVFLPEPAAAVALAGFRSLTRAPEAKMALLTPMIFVLLYGSMTLTRGSSLPGPARPFAGLAAIGLVLLSVMQLVANQFSLDRAGFRAFVLSPAPRRDILLGKNLSLAPAALGLGLVLLVLIQAVYPMRVDHLLGTVAELGSTFLLFCIVANLASILAPVPLPSGSLRPAQPKGSVVLVHLGLVLLTPPLVALAVLPLGLELLLRHLGGVELPLYFICSLPELAAVGWLYARAIAWQGRLLQRREQGILEVVTAKVE